MLKQKLKLFLVMALAAGLWSCQDADTKKQAEPITPDIELTAQEISNGKLTFHPPYLHLIFLLHY